MPASNQETEMFTTDNTDGSFMQADMALMNQAVALLMERGLEENNASDLVNNNWQESGNTLESLVAS